MKKEHIDNFRIVWRRYKPSLFMKKFAPIVENLEVKFDVRLRIDAKCFLFINFRDMIYSILRKYDDIALHNDLYLIFKSAKSHVSPKENISAHLIIEVIHRIWDELTFSKLWG